MPPFFKALARHLSSDVRLCSPRWTLNRMISSIVERDLSPMPSPTPLTPSEIVLVHGNRFAETKRPVGFPLGLLLGIIVFLVTLFFPEPAAVHHTWSSCNCPLHPENLSFRKSGVAGRISRKEHLVMVQRYPQEAKNINWVEVDHELFQEGPGRSAWWRVIR